MSAEQIVTIQDTEDSQILATGQVMLGGQICDVTLRTVVFYPKLVASLGDYPSQRTMTAVFLHSSADTAMLELVAGPAMFSTSETGHNSQVVQEAKILDLLSQYGVDRSRVSALPNARQAYHSIYESTSAGISLERAVLAIQVARQDDSISEQEGTLLLSQLYTSAQTALRGLHNKGIKHNHPHCDNFAVNPHTAEASVLDYTFAVSERHPDTIYIAGQLIIRADEFEQDFRVFRSGWRNLVSRDDLLRMERLTEINNQALREAVSKLEPSVMRLALREVGIDYPSEEDVNVLRDARTLVISNAPTLSYPKKT